MPTKKIGDKIQPITPEIREAYRIYKWKLRHESKQNYKKSFKKANTRKIYNTYKSFINGG